MGFTSSFAHEKGPSNCSEGPFGIRANTPQGGSGELIA
jgi:hypothetical protein